MELTKEAEIWIVCLGMAVAATLAVYAVPFLTDSRERDQRIHREQCEAYREQRANIRWLGGLED